MKLEAIKAAETLLNAKLISEQQFAELVIKSLNGHAAPAIAVQQPQLPLSKQRKRLNVLGIEQMGAVVEMHLMGQPNQVIAETINQRYKLKLTKGAIEQIIVEIRNGRKATHQRYQSVEWQTALNNWQRALSA